MKMTGIFFVVVHYYCSVIRSKTYRFSNFWDCFECNLIWY
jgi:hypothetical protein